MHQLRADAVKEAITKKPEVRPRREAARGDEYELAAVAQQERANSHEQAVNIRLAMNDCSCSLSARVGLVQFEIGRVCKHRIKSVLRRDVREKTAHATQGVGVLKNEIGSHNLNSDRRTLLRSPDLQSFQHFGEHLHERRVNLVSDKLDAARRIFSQHERLDCGTKKNTRARGRIENSDRVACDLDLRGDEIRHANGRQIEAVLFPMIASDAGGIGRAGDVRVRRRATRIRPPQGRPPGGDIC